LHNETASQFLREEFQQRHFFVVISEAEVLCGKCFSLGMLILLGSAPACGTVLRSLPGCRWFVFCGMSKAGARCFGWDFFYISNVLYIIAF